MKYYVVIAGRVPGIYETWAECEAQTKGFKGAKFKSYPNKNDAEMAFQKGQLMNTQPPQKKAKTTVAKEPASFDDLPKNAISVDVGTHGNPGPTEYRIVDIHSRKELYRSGVFKKGTNNLGELLGLLHAVKYASEQPEPPVVFTDSKTAMSWFSKKQYSTTIERNTQTATLFDQIEKGFEFMRQNQKAQQVRICKWDKTKYGEIPADFNRK